MQMEINGKTMTAPNKFRDVALLDFIRDFAGLKGTKFGCGAGLCGACTVHIDGKAARSCQLSVADAVGRRVTTIEGLAATAPTGELHPLQEIWIQVAVPQCGYCQPGQIMTAAALLNHNPDPSDTEIRAEMSGNLCRCGTYPRILQAVAQAAKESKNASNL